MENSILGKEFIMEQEIKRMVIIKTQSREEEFRIADKIHNQLVGNPDYIESRICLNMSKDRDDGTENEVHLIIFNDSESDPEITI